jgi:hypothetical protein
MMNIAQTGTINNSHRELLPANFAENSRVWIYQASRPFTIPENGQIEEMLGAFVRDWKTHGTPVKGFAGLFYDQFIILIADETATGVSGCSTDSSVHLVKQIQQDTGVRLFDRLELAFYIGNKTQLINVSQLPDALKNGLVTPDTLYFNNSIQTKQELEAAWLIPMKDSWLGKKYLTAGQGKN